MPAAPDVDPVAERCRLIHDEHLRLLDRSTLTAANPWGVAPAFVASLPAGLGRCTRTAHGAWAVTLDAIMPGQCPHTCAMLAASVVRIDADGQLEKPMQITSSGAAVTSVELSDPLLVDVDGKGDDELIVTVTSTMEQALDAHLERSTWTQGAIFFVDDGAVHPYGGAGVNLSAARPGQPVELLSDTPYFGTARLRCPLVGDGPCARVGFATVATRVILGPDGAMTLELADVDQLCRQPPGAIVVPSTGPVDLDQTARNIACARARGVTSDAVDAALRAQRRRIPVEEYPSLLSWSIADPPTALP
jgi:hypothetical protein